MTPEDNKAATGQDGEADRHAMDMDREAYEQISALLQGPLGAAGEDTQIRNMAARLALLEQNFARICTVVGKLEQEIGMLKGEAADERL